MAARARMTKAEEQRRYKRAAVIMAIPGGLFGTFMGVVLADFEHSGLTLDAVLTVPAGAVLGAAFGWLLMRGVALRMASFG
jgi:hypothetical protein